MKMNEPKTSRLYDLWALFYDHSFGALVSLRQKRAVEELRPQKGDRILEIGIGTGMTLKHYPRDISLVGIDLSRGMLNKATSKINKLNIDSCYLVQADAMLPPLAEHSFDHILICHAISVVSDPAKLLQWAKKLVKPGGRIVVLNHFLSHMPMIAWLEKRLNPLCVKIGWRSDLSLEECLWQTDLRVLYQFKMNMIDLWEIVILSPIPTQSPLTSSSSEHPAIPSDWETTDQYPLPKVLASVP